MNRLLPSFSVPLQQFGVSSRSLPRFIEWNFGLSWRLCCHWKWGSNSKDHGTCAILKSKDRLGNISVNSMILSLYFLPFFDNLATYSASILHRVSLHLKPLDYQMRLSKELKKSLRDAGVLETAEDSLHADSPDRLPDVPQEPIPRPRARNTTLNEVESVGCMFFIFKIVLFYPIN